jgi:hypothetical protein
VLKLLLVVCIAYRYRWLSKALHKGKALGRPTDRPLLPKVTRSPDISSLERTDQPAATQDLPFHCPM